MQVTPRLKNVEREKVMPPEDVSEPEVAAEQQVQEQTESWMSGNTVIIWVFAFIIVILLIVIVWMVTRSDKSIMPWCRSLEAPLRMPPQPQPPQPQQQPKEIPQNLTQANIQELAQYAMPPVPPKDEQAALDKEIDNQMEAKLSAQITQLTNVSADDASPSPSAIDEIIDTEVSKLDAEQYRPIEQINKKTNMVVQVFLTADSLKAKYDMEKVLICCNGGKETHKNFIWRFCK